jgi:hypothetical protein
MHITHNKGLISETILTEYFLRHKFYVFKPTAAFGPIDLVVISSETGKIYTLDAKTESFRKLKGRSGKYRISRVLSKEQKKMGVRIAYVNIDTREINIVPPIPELVETEEIVRRKPEARKPKKT